MPILRRVWQREGVDRDVRLPQPNFQIPSPQQGRELAVAVAQIEDDRERVVLLRVGHEKVQEEALAAAGGAQDEGMADYYARTADLTP